MRVRTTVTALVFTLALASSLLAAWLTHGSWRGWLDQSRGRPVVAGEDGDGHAHVHGDRQRVRLTPQARANLRLVVEPARPQTYWQTVQVPGTVVERRGRSDRSLTTPIASVVHRVLAVPGDTVRPGDELFVLRLTSETLRSSQTELYKAAQDLKISQERLARNLELRDAIPERNVREARYEIRRLESVRKAYRQDLASRGLTSDQIGQVEDGRFLTEITVRVPGQHPATTASAQAAAPLLEVEELKVQLGEQVQAGQVLCLLANHQSLHVEGRGFKEDAPLVARSAENGWPVEASFTEDREGDWPALRQELTIQYLANALDPTSQTFPFYVPLTNQHREYTRSGKTYRLWRFRPGQRVRLGVRVQEFRDVFVLPADAVVREGPDAYVFRQNGDAFDRRPVHVMHEDHRHAVIANDGSITPGNYVARNAAAALDRALKASAAGEEGGHGHEHHHHHH